MNRYQWIAASLAAMTAASVMPMNLYAADNNLSYRKKVIGVSGIMLNTTTGMEDPVTRAQFAQMLVKASTYKDYLTTASNTSVYADVPITNEYASAVKIAADNKWMTGYLGGLFKPDQPVTLKEAVKGILALLGYTEEDFKNNASNTRMALFYSLELNDNLDRQETEILNRNDCVNLFYNLLKTKMKGGNTVYGTTIGFGVNSDGEINPMELADNSLTGPKVVPKGRQLGDYVPVKPHMTEVTCFHVL